MAVKKESNLIPMHSKEPQKLEPDSVKSRSIPLPENRFKMLKEKALFTQQVELLYLEKRNNEAKRIQALEKTLNDCKNQLSTNTAELRKAQSTLYEQTRLIRVTDDDLSTIKAKLGAFYGKVSQFPPNTKEAFKRKNNKIQDIKHFFTSLWHKDEETRNSIEILFSETDQSNERIYLLVSLLVEKFISDKVYQCIFNAPIHLDRRVNDSFSYLENLFKEADKEQWISRLKLQVAKATATVNSKKIPFRVEINDSTKKSITDDIVNTLANIYDVAFNNGDITERIRKLVDMAADLSLPIRGQGEEIKIRQLRVRDRVIPAQVKGVYKEMNVTNPPTIFLGVSPVFLAMNLADDEEEKKNDDSYLQNHSLLFHGKAVF